MTRARLIAVQRGGSLSSLLTRTLEEIVERETGYAPARARSLALLAEGRPLDTGGAVSWRREELHER